LKRAVVAAEDARFLEHEGVDWEAMQKAYEQNLRRGPGRARRLDDLAAAGEKICSCRRTALTGARLRSC